MNLINRIVNWFKNIFSYIHDITDADCEEYHLPRPPFEEMNKWTKQQIDDHAETYGIMLDRRKKPEQMIIDYRVAYEELLDRLGIK